MARTLATSSQPKWGKLKNFSVITVGIQNSSPSSYQVAAFSGTLKGLAAISTTASANVRDETASINLYTISSANVAYIGTPTNPLFSYNYPALNRISLNSNGVFAGIIGDIPDGFQVAVVCFRSAAGQAITVANGPATLKYFKLVFVYLGGGQEVSVRVGPTSPTVVKRLVSGGTSGVTSQAEMEFIHLGDGGVSIGDGQTLEVNLGLATTTYLAGIFLLGV
jgi:hypothetical protein